MTRTIMTGIAKTLASAKKGTKVIAITAAAAAAIMVPGNSLSASEDATEPKFETHFAPFAEAAAPVVIQPEAVDLTEIVVPREPKPKPKAESATTVRGLGTGVASFYGKRFHGRLTANGERFNMNAMTAAHKKLRFGTKVRVTNLANGKSVVVRINDRGPFIRGRTIDLSRGAAKRIGMISRGHAKVKLEIVK